MIHIDFSKVTKENKEEYERLVSKDFDVMFRKKLYAEKLRRISVSNGQLFRDMVSQYKERGIFPSMPYEIADYYEDPNDKVIAILLGTLILSRNRHNVYIGRQKESLRIMLGEHPWRDLFCNRGYVTLSTTEEREKKFDFSSPIKNYQISKIVDSMWQAWDAHCDKRHTKTLGTVFKEIVDSGDTPHGAMIKLVDTRFIKEPSERIDEALMALCETDGISYRLWNLEGENKRLLCPNTKAIRNFVENIAPDFSRIGFDINDIAVMHGLKKATDLWYLNQAYQSVFFSDPAAWRKYLRRMRTVIKKSAITKKVMGHFNELRPRSFVFSDADVEP